MSLDPVSNGDPHVPAHNAERTAINALEVDVAKKIYKPNTVSLGSMLRWDGDNWVASKMRIFEGNGSPEGVVSAPVGSRYVDATAASGVPEYLKATGTGTTGWVPLNTSLPWTTITPGAGYAHTSGKTAQACMVNDVVYLRGGLRRTSGTGATVGTLPTGMWPAQTIQCYVRAANSLYLFDIGTTGVLSIQTSIVSNADVWLASAMGAPFKRS